MNVELRIQETHQLLQDVRIRGWLGLGAVLLLYLALAIPAIETKPIMALCSTVVIACAIPLLLRWHRLTVEQRLLEELSRGHTSSDI